MSIIKKNNKIIGNIITHPNNNGKQNTNINNNSILIIPSVDNIMDLDELSVEKYEMNNNIISNSSARNINVINRLYNDNIFNKENDKYKQFGGYQGALNENIDYWLSNEQALEIIRTYYPEASLEEIELLFYRMHKVGCSYIAIINTLMYQYLLIKNQFGKEKFEKKFGFSPIEGTKLGDSFDFYKDYNYELLFLDFFLYYSKEFMGFQTIEECIGNAEEQREKEMSGDAALANEEIIISGSDGVDTDIVAEAFQNYLATKGININVLTNIPIDPNSDDYKSKFEHLQKIGLSVEPGTDLFYEPKDIMTIINNIIAKNDNMMMNVGASNFNMYSPNDEDGNGLLDDIVYSNVGPHAMTVVGTTSDPNKIVISSWGNEYVIDISNITDYTIIDYSEFNNN